MPVRLVEVAAELLATEGRPAVTARRVAAGAGVSTQAVYTHFGGMDDLLAEIWREGFRRFGRALDAPRVTADPVADFVLQGWGYRAFALGDRHLYRVMFGDGRYGLRDGDPADLEAASATYQSLLRRIEACVEAGRWEVTDVFTAGEVVWGATHGHVSIELTGYFENLGREPARTYREVLRRVAMGFGDHAEAIDRSLASARRRARRELARNENTF